jgi:hypothetical protein
MAIRYRTPHRKDQPFPLGIFPARSVFQIDLWPPEAADFFAPLSGQDQQLHDAVALA